MSRANETHPLVQPVKSSQSISREERMDMKQILIFSLCLVSVWTCRMKHCCDESELAKAAERKLESHYPQPQELVPAAQEPGSPPSCPVALFAQQTPAHLSNRSLSPWRYVRRTMKDHFPSSYAEAQCLCFGCVLIQDNKPPVENHNYNSVPVIQSRVFLKKEPCSDGEKYYLKPVSVKVAVGCTCARPAYN
ncbi:interleukin-17C [Clinocottus analis]|uniref:interleukin-17C n=1 Tax=Clinocottus analis TaxID=304258 RepID=UPI0035BF3342